MISYYKHGLALSNSNNDDSSGNINIRDEVRSLKEQATRARLEAERMQVDLTLKKISDLEDKLSQNGINSDESASIQINIDKLKKILDPDDIKVGKNPTPLLGNYQADESRDAISGEGVAVLLLSLSRKEREKRLNCGEVYRIRNAEFFV